MPPRGKGGVQRGPEVVVNGEVVDRLAYTQKDAAAALDMSVNHFKAHVRPHVRAAYVGGKTLYPADELRRFLTHS